MITERRLRDVATHSSSVNAEPDPSPTHGNTSVNAERRHSPTQGSTSVNAEPSHFSTQANTSDSNTPLQPHAENVEAT